jgi:excisionase family DNA binding protein
MSLDDRRSGRSAEWMGTHEAATLMGVSPATLRRWSDAGEIVTFTTPGGHRRFSRTMIAGILPATRAGAPDGYQLDRLHRSLVRAVRQGWGRVLADLDSPISSLDPTDRAVLAEHGLRAIDGIVAQLDPNAIQRAERMRAARRSAAASGALAARRGISLRPTLDAALRLRSVVVRAVAEAAQRLGLDSATTSQWILTVTCALDELMAETMRGHEQLARPAGAAHQPSIDGR